MPLTPGTRLGPYEIGAPLGAGGMGEVYRARDARLGREVAVKALPASSANDPERIERFEREAQILAGLSHPHIAALYGLEESGPPGSPNRAQFLIMELVEGGTLSDRLRTGPLPVRDAITIARQIADALQAAHDRGIIHRDLKPANIAFTADGHVKVLDFGLAKAATVAADAPTVAPGGTQSGVVLGTAAYMSPEQARGQTLDKRTDIFSFGCVLYEMLAARNPFPGENVSDVLVSILSRDPDWTLLPAATPARVQWLLRRCLEKDPRRRLHDIADARIELDEALTQPGESGPMPAVATTRGRVTTRERSAWIIAVASAAVLAGFLIFRGRPAPSVDQDTRTYRAVIPFPEQVTLTDEDPARFALSPDGKKLAFIATGPDGRSVLWVRPLDGLVAQPLTGTEGATYPFWSSDSRFIGFIQRAADILVTMRGQLKKVPAEGGQLVTLTALNFGATPAWSGDVILFTPAGNAPLHRISAGGGLAVPATTLDVAAGEVQHSQPAFLPDGRHFLYSAIGSAKGGATDARAVYVGTLDSKDAPRPVLERAVNAVYASGYLLFKRDATLMAQTFDPDRLEPRGEPQPLAERVAVGNAASAFSASDTGVLMYQTAPLNRTQLTWFDRSGKPLGSLGDQADYLDVVLSPNGERAATSVLHPETGTRDIWIFDVLRGLREPFTTGTSDDFAPVWSPRGDRVIFSSAREGGVDLYERTSEGREQRLDTGPAGIGKFAAHWSPDGKEILYIGGGRAIGRSDLMFLPIAGDRRPKPFLNSDAVETQGRFSRDGRWIAYASNTTGRLEVYVRPYPGPGEPARVSTDGGQWPQWSRDGTELFFVSPNNTLMSAAVNVRGPQFEVKTVRPLFQMRPRSRNRLDAYFYDVGPDGNRFLVNAVVESQATTMPLNLVVNWPALLKK